MNNDHEQFESREIISMFPTLVWQTLIKEEVYQPLNKDIINKLNRLKPANSDVVHGSSWQSAGDLHKLAEFEALMSLVKEMTTSVLAFLKVGHEGFELTGCWGNMNESGSSHKSHSHPNNFLSGVYYVQTQEGADTINFHDPRAQTGIIRPPVTELSNENTDQVVVNIRDGMFLLFPSWLQHSVDANQSAETRISVSFNIMFSSYVDSMSKPLW